MELTTFFEEHFNRKPLALSRAPGRLEILGNHTDYNEGVVLSCAVEQHIDVAIAPAPGNVCRIADRGFNETAEFTLDAIDRPIPGDWTNYIRGVIFELRKRGIEIGGFNAALASTVPLSAGMSSSAALEISVCFALKAVFGIELPKKEWALLGQSVENNYLGVSTGLLDQFSSIYGEKDALILSDFRTNDVLKTVKIPHGYVLVVINSMEKHDLVDSDYNVRRQACESAAGKLHAIYPEVKTLRDVSMTQLDNAKSQLTHMEYLRAKHVVGECERVIQGVSLLEKGDVKAFGQLLFESHESSRINFENSSERLDYLVELAKCVPGGVGARLSGGGFGGISIHLVEEAAAEEYGRRAATAFKLQTGDDPQVITCAIGAGAKVKMLQQNG